jgi:thiol-disulfide isomerase/thioredoxin
MSRETPMHSILIPLLLTIGVTGGSTPTQFQDVNGREAKLFAPAGKGNVLVFVATDCPISNAYAPEVQRLCARYRANGIACVLVYEDLKPGADDVRRHLAEYRYRDVQAIIDGDRTIARRAGATVTPQAVVIDRAGAVRYRGRVDNFYAALGKPRRRATVHDLRDALDAMLAGKPVPHPETEALGCYISFARQ